MDKNDVVRLNCKTEEGRKILEKELKKIKPLKKFDEISIEKLESLLTKLHEKRNCRISYILPVIRKENKYFSASILNNENKLQAQVYARDVWELFAKASCFMYQYESDGDNT